MTPLTPSLFTLHEVRQVDGRYRIRFIASLLSATGEHLSDIELAQVETVNGVWLAFFAGRYGSYRTFKTSADARRFVRETLGLNTTRKSVTPPAKPKRGGK